MSLLAKFSDLAVQREALADADPSKVVIDEILSPTEAMINGRHTILAGTNNYLGLTFDPDCIAAGQAALAEMGTGTTGSRMANGNYSGHRALERSWRRSMATRMPWSFPPVMRPILGCFRRCWDLTMRCCSMQTPTRASMTARP